MPDAMASSLREAGNAQARTRGPWDGPRLPPFVREDDRRLAGMLGGMALIGLAAWGGLLGAVGRLLLD